MTTYIIMQNRIADEVRQTSTAAASDISTQITSAIQSAIKFYERQRFYFNEATTTFTTVTSQEWYSTADAEAIATLAAIDYLNITISTTQVYPLIRRTNDWLNEISFNPLMTGQPTDFAYYRQQIRLYPIPSAVWTMTLAYVKRFTTLSADSDTNAWMTDGEELIRARASWQLYQNILKSPDEAAQAHAMEAMALNALWGESNIRAHTGGVRATQF